MVAAEAETRSSAASNVQQRILVQSSSDVVSITNSAKKMTVELSLE